MTYIYLVLPGQKVTSIHQKVCLPPTLSCATRSFSRPCWWQRKERTYASLNLPPPTSNSLSARLHPQTTNIAGISRYGTYIPNSATR
jgi:hypothetical protein